MYDAVDRPPWIMHCVELRVTGAGETEGCSASREHPTDLGQIGCVVRLPAGPAGIVSEEGAGRQMAEYPPPSDHVRLSTVQGEPSDITYTQCFVSGDTALTKAALEASMGCLTCLPDEGNADTPYYGQPVVEPKEPPHHGWHIETSVAEGLAE